MKVFCNGFNLYGQLDKPELILEKFTEVFNNYCIEDIICIQHSFSVLQTDTAYLIYANYKEKPLNNCGDVIKVSSNNERVLILNKLGKIFKIELSNFSVTEIPNILNSEIADEKLVNIICGSTLHIAYTNKGTLCNIPYKMDFKNTHIADLKCGREHCILLDSIGNVFTFGRGSRGQLGHGNLDDEPEPVLLDALAGIKIVQIEAGSWHSCAISKDGDLYTWGWNGNGQLGIEPKSKGANDEKEPSVSVMASPHLVDLYDPLRNVVKVASGTRHTIILLDNSHLLGCGWNKYKQLIDDPKENVYSFTYLHDFSTEEVVKIKCGSWNSVVVCK